MSNCVESNLFSSLCTVIGTGNSRHFINRSDFKLKPIMTESPAFSCALVRLVVYTLSEFLSALKRHFLCYWLVVEITLVMETQSKNAPKERLNYYPPLMKSKLVPVAHGNRSPLSYRSDATSAFSASHWAVQFHKFFVLLLSWVTESFESSAKVHVILAF